MGAVRTILLLAFATAAALAQARLTFALPERVRLLEDQRMDLVIELRNAAPGALVVTANGADISGKFIGPESADLDCDGSKDYVWRADLVSFSTTGWVQLVAIHNGAQGRQQVIQDLVVQPFAKPEKKNVVLFIGDGMTQAWVDAGRIVSRSVETVPGVPGLRQGFFDRLLEMDRMPVSGSILTIGQDKIIPDSAPTAHGLATGNKTFDGGVGVFEDGTDCATGSGTTAATARYSLDNPKIENIAEYLKRRFGYRIGIVTTSNLPDATPTAFGAHTADRNMSFEIISQYAKNPLLGGAPAADVFMGGGGESFSASVRPDKVDVIAYFKAAGYQVARTAADLKSVSAGAGKLLGIFKEVTTTANSAGIAPSSSSVMNVAYDKLRLTRPGSEPLPNFNGWEDQPFLDLMTQKAIEVLAGPDGSQPFFLMVEGASIDKQSHSGHAAGATWDVIEFDKAIGAARAWAAARKQNDTLMVVTADHGHPMLIIGAAPITDADYFDRTGFSATMNSPRGTLTTTIYKDVNHNTRAAIPYGSVGGKTGAVSADFIDVYGTFGFPNYIDADGDGYPENVSTKNAGNFRLAYGFRTGSHTSLTLPVMAQGPGALLFTGVFDQTDIPLKIAAALATNTQDLDKALDKLVYSMEYPKTPGK
jgi:alkaline phosphatase